MIGSHHVRLLRYHSTVVPRAIVHVAVETGVGAGQLQDPLRDLEVLVLFAADVIGLARRAFAKHELDRGAVIADVQPLAPLPAVAVDRQRLTVERVRHEERDQLLRVLVRAIGVRATRDARIDPEGTDGGEHLEVSARLRRRVRAGWPQRVALARALALGNVAVDLVGRDLDEPDPGVTGETEQHVGAEHVGLDELGRAEDRAVDVCLRGEVDDRLRAGGGLRDRVGIADVAVEELDAHAVEVGAIAGVGELVEHRDALPRCGETLREVRADEAGAAGDEHAHRRKA